MGRIIEFLLRPKKPDPLDEIEELLKPDPERDKRDREQLLRDIAEFKSSQVDRP